MARDQPRKSPREYSANAHACRCRTAQAFGPLGERGLVAADIASKRNRAPEGASHVDQLSTHLHHGLSMGAVGRRRLYLRTEQRRPKRLYLCRRPDALRLPCSGMGPEADIASELRLSSRQAARSLFTIQWVVSGET